MPFARGTFYSPRTTSNGGTTPVALQGRNVCYRYRYNEVSTQDILTVEADESVDSIKVKVTESWDGSFDMQIGTPSDSDLFYTPVDMKVDSVWELQKSFSDEGPLTVRITRTNFVPPTQGELIITVQTCKQGN